MELCCLNLGMQGSRPRCAGAPQLPYMTLRAGAPPPFPFSVSPAAAALPQHTPESERDQVAAVDTLQKAIAGWVCTRLGLVDGMLHLPPNPGL